MSVISELVRIGNAKAAIRNSISNKGVTVPDNARLEEYPAFVDAISGGGGIDYAKAIVVREGNDVSGWHIQKDGKCDGAFYCTNITEIENIGEEVVSIANAFNWCRKLTKPVCGQNVTNMSYTFYNCTNLVGNPVCGENVRNMAGAYSNCVKLIGSPVCGEKVSYMSGAYRNCGNLTGSPVCGNTVRWFSSAYENCYNITGNPVCGENVTEFDGTYKMCNKLNGTPVCGESVSNMERTYEGCSNLVGTPVCGGDVKTMNYAYAICTNLTGPPVIGNSVTTAIYAYNNCSNISGDFVCGKSVTNLYSCFRNCDNISGNHYYNNCKALTNVAYLYAGKGNKRLNVFYPIALEAIFKNTTSSGIVGKSVMWSNITDENGQGYYNNSYNIYIYPVL